MKGKNVVQNANEWDKKAANSPQTVEKALALLECFSIRESKLTVNEIGSKMGISTSTLYRYITAMENKGYLEKEADTNKYVVGLRVVELAGIALSRLEVRRHGQLELDALADALDMNANLGVLYCGDVFHLAFSVRTEVDRMYTVIGRRTPAHCTAMGKILLAHLPRTNVHELIDTYGWNPLTPHSITTMERLELELDQVMQSGYAVDRGECAVNGMCIAAPVYDQSGKVIAAISVSSSKDRIEPRLNHIADQVSHYADRLSLRLGYHVRPMYHT